MSPRARNRARGALTVLAACVLLLGAASVFRGVWVFHDDGAYREHGFSIVRAAVYANYSDRSARASLMSRMPAHGWSAHTDPAVGNPAVELIPSFGSQSAPFPSWAVRVPLWIPFLLLAAPCGWAWWAHLRRPAHACEACGYDLRGTPGPTCPECGRTSAP